ncbi:hypothetical protein [Janthinobacterium kumbetense]|uniref:Uncharacterized protein n=1 Tax=Janthinobacterium kumbetense TaxID=2950280 RepID=A0ABT0WMY4_9BURK|nr:hypothetical protein [Janthinobacterium kumbetense]MCM2564814.1 hypothetical protein [Janthinobacterium kumbetense]
MVNRNPYVPPEDRADYLKSSIVNEEKAPAPAPATRKPQAKKPAAKPKRK